MLKSSLLSIFVVLLMVNVSYSQKVTLSPIQKSNIKKQKVEAVIIGDAVTTSDIKQRLENGTLFNSVVTAPVNSVPFEGTYQITDGADFYSATFTMMGGSSFYPQQSNGSPVEIWQDPNTPDNIHAVFTTCPSGDPIPGFPNRKCTYFFSSDRGVVWSNVTDIPTIRAGFGTITGTNDGKALIANHNGATVVKTEVYVDGFPGLGAFVNLSPPDPSVTGKIWPRIIATAPSSPVNKFVVVGSINSTAFDSAFVNRGTSLDASAFTGWQYVPRMGTAEVYAIARGQDGRIGVAFIASDNLPDSSNTGDLMFMESVDHGTTFGSPQVIFAGSDVDTTTVLRGLGLVYQGNKARVVFDIVRGSSSGYFPGLPSKIGYWSADINGGNYVVVASDANTFSGPRTTPYNVLTPLSRSTIGSSSDGQVLFVAFMAQDTVYGINGADTTSFSFIYLTASANGGASWKRPIRLTPQSPTKDWTFPTISPWNDSDPSNYYVNMQVSQDDVPFTDVQGALNPNTAAKNVFVRVSIPRPVFINNIGSETPSKYTLSQNYPNPFNPSTTIRFDIAKLSNVTLKVYNTRGQEVATLVNNEMVSAGVKEVSFNAASLASGIYFYTLTAGDFKETKKMMLIK